MVKIHTRRKRALGIPTKRCGYKALHPKIRAKRPKTFGTEDLANVWAKLHGIEKYTLLSVKRGKRFMIQESK
tara:strand:+ start:131 stop:346 length:216 start_codon:yes stop_codon:yes gene_type:complete